MERWWRYASKRGIRAYIHQLLAIHWHDAMIVYISLLLLLSLTSHVNHCHFICRWSFLGFLVRLHSPLCLLLLYP
jgi:hypothetical protein